MLLFRSEENIEQWCRAAGMPRGETLTLDQVWALSQRWYADRLSPTYGGRSAEQMERIFQEIGLVGPFWRL